MEEIRLSKDGLQDFATRCTAESDALVPGDVPSAALPTGQATSAAVAAANVAVRSAAKVLAARAAATGDKASGVAMVMTALDYKSAQRIAALAPTGLV